MCADPLSFPVGSPERQAAIDCATQKARKAAAKKRLKARSTPKSPSGNAGKGALSSAVDTFKSETWRT